MGGAQLENIPDFGWEADAASVKKGLQEGKAGRRSAAGRCAPLLTDVGSSFVVNETKAKTKG